MVWDPQTLRKYNSTSPFRMINQLRNELKERSVKQNIKETKISPPNISNNHISKNGNTDRLNKASKQPEKETFFYSGNSTQKNNS